MDLITLIVVILLLLWLFGYFGRGRVFGRGADVGAPPWGGNWIHTLLVILVILVILRLLRII